MDPATETAWRTWTTPECPFQIECSSRVLSEIRLLVVDAFFSLPRGGAEVGGVLLGHRDGVRIAVNDYEALDCEHATGPSFTLSARDQTHLAEMIARARRNPVHRQPVGWYHSHTRSDIFLSDSDLDIHKRYFPESWQVALVLKPHTFEPMRAGFFFREPDGSIHASASYRQFELDALPARPPAGTGANHAPAASVHREEPVLPPAEPLPPPDPPKARVPITREVAVEPAFGEAHGAAGEGAPSFAQIRPERSGTGVKVAALLAIGLAAGGVGYQYREYWLPQTLSRVRAVLPQDPDQYLSLHVSDAAGVLNIHWDRNAPAIRNATEGAIEITDGNSTPRAVRLDADHLATGAFSYARESERVDVILIVSEPTGQQVKERTSFLGRLPSEPQGFDPALVKERDAQADRADKLQKDLNAQAARTHKLEQELKDVHNQLDQKRGPDNQSPDPTKKN